MDIMETSASTIDSSILAPSSFFSQRQEDTLLLETESEYEEIRKDIIFKKLNIYEHEETLLKFLSESQLKVNKKSEKVTGFFQCTPIKLYNFSILLKENIANYCLVLTSYFKEKKIINALKLFLLMCEQNKNILTKITNKIIDFFPKISNKNRIGKFCPNIAKIMLQLLAVFIKLSGKFDKPTLENYYIILYYKIIYIISLTITKYNADSFEKINKFKNERKYFYSSCLFDSSIYLFNRFYPLSICINILQHILDLYGNKLSFSPNEMESLFLLKVNYNLGIFYYIDGYYNESISNLNQARERLLEIKKFPITPFKKHNSNKKSAFRFNSNSNNLYNFNEYLADNNYKRIGVDQSSIPEAPRKSRSRFSRGCPPRSGTRRSWPDLPKNEPSGAARSGCSPRPAEPSRPGG